MTIMMLKKTPALYALLLCLTLPLSGCGMFFGDNGWFRSRGDDYLKADKIPPLVLDESLDRQALGELYPIPPTPAVDFDDTPTTYDIPRPMPLSVNSLEEHVKIQRLGDNTWILMNIAPGDVWPRVRSFLNVNGLTVAHADISRGIIETDWIQFKTDLSTYDRYRIQIDQGVQPETSEIHIIHASIPSDTTATANVAWPSVSVNLEREKWLLDELAATLASDTTEGGTSLLAQAIGGSAKAGLVTIKGEPVLSLRLDRARALGTLAYAVKQEGFTPYDNDSATGIFYVHYRKPDADGPGWFARMFSSTKDEKIKLESPYSLAELVANLPEGTAFDNAPLSNPKLETQLPQAPGYLLLVSGEDGDLSVRVRDPYGKRLEPRKAREMLTVIRKNLI